MPETYEAWRQSFGDKYKKELIKILCSFRHKLWCRFRHQTNKTRVISFSRIYYI
jgi:hypothetical protein